MIVFVHQPEYIPWLGFFDKLSRCDTFVVYDDAQFQHGGFHNRNRIRTRRGWEWITIPIIHGHPQSIKDVKIAGTQWRNKHLNTLTLNYQKTPYFKDYFDIIKEAITFNHELLMGLNLHLIQSIANMLGIKVKMVRSSEFPYSGKQKNEKLTSMCKLIGADSYLSGSGGKNYLNEAIFNQANINVQWHNYEHPTYRQNFSGFHTNMSILDLLFNMGPESLKIINKGGIISNYKYEILEAPEILIG